MSFQYSLFTKKLNFTFNARTSRGTISEHKVYYLKIWTKDDPKRFGIGECAPLKGLSPDYVADLKYILEQFCDSLSAFKAPESEKDIYDQLKILDFNGFPSISFGLELALLDWLYGGKRAIYPDQFQSGYPPIPINGLVWMSSIEQMKKQALEKYNAGFKTIKLKIGAHDFMKELELLSEIRKHCSDAVLRLDANGAFVQNEALAKLKELARFQIHSIEQPIKPKNWDMMRDLCKFSPIPIALDEELIGINSFQKKKEILVALKPQFIILKPTLVGGLYQSLEWIRLAEKMNIGWWLTSALESNIGLNGIYSLAAKINADLPQGLGTGSLYNNNIVSPLEVAEGYIHKSKQKEWGLELFE